MTYTEAISLRLRELCRERNLSLNGMAMLAGLNQSTLENIVKGKSKSPGLRTLHRIATGLNMTVAELLDFPLMNEGLFEGES